MASETDPSQAGADENSYEGADVEVSPSGTDGDAKPGGLGTDGTIPDAPGGVAAGYSDTASNFNAEED